VPPPHSKADIPGQTLVAETEEDLALWERKWAAETHYACNLCCDGDSYLKRPDGAVLHHRGHTRPIQDAPMDEGLGSGSRWHQ
jgi:hypothetical protein